MSRLASTSRLWTSATEEVVFELSFSEPNPMFVEASYVINASIADLDSTLPLTIKAIRGPTTSFEVQGTRFHVYEFAFALGLIPDIGFEIQLVDAVLNLAYIEGIAFSFPIGDFALLIDAIQMDSPLALVRMYGRKGNDGCGGVQHLMIGIENLSAVAITIEAISSGFAQVHWRPLRIASEHPANALDRLSLFGSEINFSAIVIPGNEVRYIVWERADSRIGLERFYVEIAYRQLR
ncbi:MAG: hypothetical protein MZU97_03905 [Bacillus subtilis]|nr:hypothetical protein [Bacillus subtilis]